MNAVLTYLKRNLGRWVQVGEALLKVGEALLTAAAEIVPLTPSVKDDAIIAKIHDGFVKARRAFDKARDWLLKYT